MLGLRVLDDVGQRLLHDAVEDGLDFTRQPALGEPRLELRRRFRSALRSWSMRRSSAGANPEVVESLRAQLDGKPPDVLKGRP